MPKLYELPQVIKDINLVIRDSNKYFEVILNGLDHTFSNKNDIFYDKVGNKVKIFELLWDCDSYIIKEKQAQANI